MYRFILSFLRALHKHTVELLELRCILTHLEQFSEEPQPLRLNHYFIVLNI
jgi:hypothetical protein